MTREELLKYRLDGSKSFPFYIKEQEITDKYGVYSTGVFKYKGMSLIIAIEYGLWHLSVSAKFPLGYQQLKDVRYKFLPNNIQVAQIFPPREEFVNLHSTCWHLWEIKD